MANISITIKTTAQAAGVKAITTALSELLKELKEINASAKTLGSTFTASSKAAVGAIGSITSAANAASSAITAAGKNAGSAFGSAASAASGFGGAASSAGAAAASGLANVSGAVANVGGAVDAAKVPIQNYGLAWENVAFSIAHNLTTHVMNKLGELAMAIPNFAKQSVDTAASFEDLMQQFEATSGSGVAAAGLEIKAFEDLVLDVGARLPVTVLDATKMMIDMAKGGLNVAGMFNDSTQETVGTLESTINFMDAAFVGPERAAEISAKSLAMWRDSTNTLAEDTAQLVAMQDTLVKAANSSTTDVDQLFLGMTNAAAAAKTAGISFDDFTGILSYMVDGFSNANTAGTSMRYLFNNLQPNTEPARLAMQELGWTSLNVSDAISTLTMYGEDYGISLEDIGDSPEVLREQLTDLAIQMGKTRSETEKFIQQHEKSVFFSEKGTFLGIEHMIEQFDVLKQMMDSGQNAKVMKLAKDIFGEEGKQSVTAIIAKGDRKAYEEYIQTMMAANGVGATAAIVQQGYEFAVEQFMGTLEAASISLGNRLLPVMEQIVTIGGEVVGVFLGQEDSLGRIKDAIPKIYDAANQLVGEAYQYIIDMAPKVGQALADVVPIIVGQFSVLSGDIVESMDIILPQWRAILGAMSGALLVFAGPSIIGVATKAIGAISTAFVTARGSAFAFFASLGPLLPLALAIGVAAAVVANNWGALEKAFNDAGGGISGAAAAIGTLGTIISTWIEQELPVLLLQLGDQAVLLWKWIEEAIPPTLQRFNRWWTTIMAWMETQWPLWQQQLVDWAVSLWKWIQNAIPDVQTQLQGWWNTLVNYLNGQLPQWGATLVDWATRLWDWITGSIGTTEQALTTWWNELVANVNAMFPEWEVQFMAWRATLFQWITNSGPTTILAIGQWYRNLEQWIIGELPKWLAQLEEWAKPLWGFIEDAIPDLAPTIETWYNKLKDEFGKKLPGWATTFLSWRQTLWQWIQDSWADTSVKVQGWWSTLTTEVSRLYAQWAPQFVAWGQQLWQWILNASSTVVTTLQNWFNTIVRWTQSRPEDLALEFANWAVEAYEWIKTAADQSLIDLGAWINEILDWIIAEAPELRRRYLEWQRESVMWILEGTSQLMVNLNTWFTSLVGWIIREGPAFALSWVEWTVKTASWILLATPAAIAALSVFLGDLINWVTSNLGNWDRNVAKFNEALTALFGLPTRQEVDREAQLWWNSISGFLSRQHVIWQTQTIAFGAELWKSIETATAEFPVHWQRFANNMMAYVASLGALLNTATGGWIDYMVVWIPASIDRMVYELAQWGASLNSYIIGFLPGWAQTMLMFGTTSHRWVLDSIPDLLINVGLFMLSLQTKVLDYLEAWVAQWAPFASGAVQWLRDAINPMNTEVGNLLTGARDALSSPSSQQKIQDGVAPLSSVAAMWPTNATSQLTTNTSAMVTSAGDTLASTQSIIDSRLASYTTAAQNTYGSTTLSGPASTMVTNAAATITGSRLGEAPTLTTSPYYNIMTATQNVYGPQVLSTPASTMVTNAAATITGSRLGEAPTLTTSPYYNMMTSAQNTYGSTTLSGPAATMVTNAVTAINTASSSLRAGYGNPISVWSSARTQASGAFSATLVSVPAKTMTTNAVSAVGSALSPFRAGYTNEISVWGSARRVASGAFSATLVSGPAATMTTNAVDAVRNKKQDFTTAFDGYTTAAKDTFKRDTMVPGATAMVNKIGDSFKSRRDDTYGSIIVNSMKDTAADAVKKMDDEFKNSDTVTRSAIKAARDAWGSVRSEFQRGINRLPVPGGGGGSGTGNSFTGSTMAYNGALPTTPMVPGASPGRGGDVINNYTTINFSPAYHGSGISQSSDVALARIMAKV